MNENRTPPREWNNPLSAIPEPIRPYVINDAWRLYDRVFAQKTLNSMTDMMRMERDNVAVTTGLCNIVTTANMIDAAGLKNMPNRSFKRYIEGIELAEKEAPGNGVRHFLNEIKPMMDKRFALLKTQPKDAAELVVRKPKKRRKSTKHLLEEPEKKAPHLF